jgi:hypothetical protein
VSALTSQQRQDGLELYQITRVISAHLSETPRSVLFEVQVIGGPNDGDMSGCRMSLADIGRLIPDLPEMLRALGIDPEEIVPDVGPNPQDEGPPS